MTPTHAHLWQVLTYTRWAVEHSRLTPPQRMLAITVATYYSHTDGYARPPWRELQNVIGMSRATLHRWLRAIAAEGIWTADHSYRRATRYRFPVGPDVLSPARRDIHRGLTRETSPLSTPGLTHATTEVSPVRPELTTETRDGLHTRDESPPARQPAVGFSLRVTVDPVPADAPWSDYA